MLGSGELGKELTAAAQHLGHQVIAVDRYKGAPAMQLADKAEVIDMLDAEALDSTVQSHKPDIIIPEIETIRTDRLQVYEDNGIVVAPSAKAVGISMNRKSIRDLAAKKLKLRTPSYFYATSLDELFLAVKRLGTPCVVKPMMSSSGKGQSIVREHTDIEKAWRSAVTKGRGESSHVIVEKFIDFEQEITLLTVTRKNAPPLFCPPIGHKQERGDYQESWQPTILTKEQLEEAQSMAAEVTEALGGVGIWGVEFLLTKDSIYFLEVSPGPHDTGFVTLAGTQEMDQFQLHLHAILGLEIPEISLVRAGASAAILTQASGTTPQYSGLEEAYELANSDYRIFGKPLTHPYRRMGVAVAYDQTDTPIDEVRKRANDLAQTIKVR